MTHIAQPETFASTLESLSNQGREVDAAMPSHEEMRTLLGARLEHLTPHQLRDAWCQINGIRKQHAVDFRVSVWLPFVSRCYVSVAAGKEQRRSERLAQDGLTNPSRLATFYAIATFAIIGFSLFGFFCFAYLIKSMLKINVFAGRSVFHPLYALFIA